MAAMLIIDWHLLAKKWQYHTYCIWYCSSVTWFTQCNLAIKLAIIWSKRCFTCICIIYNCNHCSPEHLPLPCPSNSHDGRHLGFWQYLRHWVAENGKKCIPYLRKPGSRHRNHHSMREIGRTIILFMFLEALLTKWEFGLMSFVTE